jgi:hypothetical protein
LPWTFQSEKFPSSSEKPRTPRGFFDVSASSTLDIRIQLEQIEVTSTDRLPSHSNPYYPAPTAINILSCPNQRKIHLYDGNDIVPRVQRITGENKLIVGLLDDIHVVRGTAEWIMN